MAAPTPRVSGKPQQYYQAYCFDCAHAWFDGSHSTEGDDYPGRYEVSEIAAVRWSQAHIADNAGHLVSIRLQVRDDIPVGVL